MKNSRRSFLKIAGVSALGIGATPVLNVVASSDEHGSGAKPQMRKNKSALTAKQWAMVVDTRKIHGKEDLEPMIKACHKAHNVPEMPKPEDKDKVNGHEIKWIWEEEYHYAFPNKENKYLDAKTEHTPVPVLCNHCEEPPCVRVCPTKATFKREDGIVMMDFHRCIGCRFCMSGCPYGSRSFNFVDPRKYLKETSPGFPTRTKGVVEKCNFCAERLAVGKMPACVEASNGILTFGNLEDPHSNVRKLLESNYTIRRKQDLGTGPCVYYIV